jgi:uncharacterized protein
MPSHLVRLIVLLGALALFSGAPARAQSTPPQPSPEAVAAAKELVETMHLTHQFEAILPSVLKTIKPSIVQGRPEVDREYDALVPALVDSFRSRLTDLADAMAVIYATNFSADDLHAIIAFYQTPVGQKMLEKLPALSQQTMASGAKFGRSVAEDLRNKMIEELRKKGIDL